MKGSRKTSAVRLSAIALAAIAITGTATAQDRQAALNAAVAAIQAFPGRTLHGDGHSYSLRDAIQDADGSMHVRVDRRYRGLRVIGGDMVVHMNRSGALLNVSRSLDRSVALDLTPALSADQARGAAEFRNPNRWNARNPELVVYARGAAPVLAWAVFLAGEQDDGTPSELNVMIDARSGVMLDRWDDVHTAPAIGTGNSLFLGAVALATDSTTSGFAMRDPTRGNQSTVDMNNRRFGQGVLFTDADNVWGNGSNSNRQTVGVDAQYGAQTTWDYFLNVHGRNGIANDGVGARSRVHYSRNYANAFWQDSCFCMTYGDGNGTSILPLVSLDVAGHEMAHGVTSRTAALVYSGESGGLNEATSDIFGAMVEFYAANANDVGDYLIGEKIFANGTSFIRNMVKPSVDGVSADCWYPAVGSLDVHYSSGIANHFFYLLAEGTTGGSPSPTCNAGDTRIATGTGSVSPIGRAKAERIWYRALTVYMTTSTTYAQARAATISAANDLYGAGSPESAAVAAAWTAVKVN